MKKIFSTLFVITILAFQAFADGHIDSPGITCVYGHIDSPGVVCLPDGTNGQGSRYVADDSEAMTFIKTMIAASNPLFFFLD